MASWTPARILLLVLTILLFLPGNLCLADEADDQYAVAAGVYARRQWKLAAEEFRSFVEKYPKHPKCAESLFFLGETLLQLEKYDLANVRFREYLQRQPQGEFALSASFRAAECLYFLNQFDRAKTELAAFAAKHSADKLNANVLAYLGNIALTQNDPAAAERQFRQCLTQFPEGAMQDDCRFGLARALEKQAKYDEAERYYLGLAGKLAGPFAADSQFRLGAMQYAQGKYAAAVQSFEPFESTFAKSNWQAMARLGRSWALLKLNKSAEAKAFLERIASDPHVGPEARYWLGLAQKSEKNWRAAAQTLLDAAAANPKHKLAPAMRFHAGDALLRADDFPAAVEQFDKVLTSSSDNEWLEQALRGKIQVELRSKDYAGMDRDAADFVKRFPQTAFKDDVQRMLARSLVERKQFQRAKEVLEPMVAAATKDNPRLEDRYLLSLAYEGLERREEALKVVAPVVESASGQLKADALLTRASLLVALKQYQEAIEPLESFLAGKPTGDAAVKGLGQLAICYARVKEIDKAKARYDELIKGFPQHELLVPTTEQLADAVYEAGDSEWSSRLFTWLSSGGQLSDRETRGLSGLAWSQYKAGQLEKAAETFGQVLKRKPGAALAAEAALVRGRILQQLNQADAALAMYTTVIDRYPKSPQMPDALWGAARLHNSLKQYKQATALYERLLKEFPQFSEADSALYKWAWALADQGQQEQATALFQRLRKEFPRSALWPDAVFRLAQWAFEGKNYARARELATQLLASRPAAGVRENALYLSGQVAIGEEKWDAAVKTFDDLVKEFPKSSLRPMAEFGMAEAVFRQGDYGAAAERFQRLMQQTGWRDKFWPALIRLRLAQAMCHQQRWKDALAIASQIEREYPGFDEQYEVDYVIGRCLADQVDFDGARTAYRKVIQSANGAKTETAAKAQLMIAETFYHQKNYESALREYLRVEILYAFPAEQAAAVLQAGRCHEHLGEWKQAADAYARLLKTYPNTTFAKEAGQRLRAAQERASGSRG